MRVEEEYGPDWSLLWLFAADVDRKVGFVFNLGTENRGIYQQRLVEESNEQVTRLCFWIEVNK